MSCGCHNRVLQRKAVWLWFPFLFFIAEAQLQVARILDDIITVGDALEGATIAQALYGVNATNSLEATNQNYNDIRFYESPTSSSTTNGVETRSDYWIGSSSSKLIVAFRGSQDYTSFVSAADREQVALGPVGTTNLQDLVMYHVNVTGQVEEVLVRVHSGFNQAVFSNDVYSSIAGVVEPLLATSSYNSIYVIGHSLGGAQAALFGTYFAFNHPTIATYLYTYGQPRVGNFGFKIFSESIPNLNYWRMVNDQDIVARVPFRDYHHAGHLVWRRRASQLSSSFEFPAFFRTTGNDVLGLDGIEDFSLAVLRPEEVQPLIEDHLLPAGILPWLSSAQSNADLFPTAFQRL